LSKSRIVGDNSDFSTVTVVDQEGRSAIGNVTIYFGTSVITGDKIKYSAPLKSKVYAEYKGIKSNEADIEVIEDSGLKFEKNVLVEQYTGTWCGYCPRAVYQIHLLELLDKRIVHSALHLTDVFAYSLNNSLFKAFGFTGVPTVHADRTLVWAGDVSSINSLHSPSRIGIGIEVTGDAANITASVKVKFGYEYPEGLKLSVYLTHDSLVAGQANFYNSDPSSPYYQKGSTMDDFVHRNVLIKAGTDMFGDAIPAASVTIGGIYSKNILFSGFRCEDIRKMTVIAVVSVQDSKQAGKVVNSVKAQVGEKKDFVIAGN
jgi:thiol-disulfide isomerase/thioredoxin